MNIITVTVGWSETCSLPEYNNIKPSITLSAQIGEGEDAQATTGALLAECKRVVQQQVDAALEACGKRPRYYAGPRYQVVVDAASKVVLVMPNEVRLPDIGFGRRWQHVFSIERGISRAGAVQLARGHADDRHYYVITADDVEEAKRQLNSGSDSEAGAVEVDWTYE